MPKARKDVGHPNLRTWNELNCILQTADEAKCLSLLETEKKGRARRTFLLRIHSRLNRVRRETERKKLLGDHL